MTRVNWMAIGNGEKVQCRNCSFSFIMSETTNNNLFDHKHEGIDIFNMWDVDVKEGDL